MVTDNVPAGELKCDLGRFLEQCGRVNRTIQFFILFILDLIKPINQTETGGRVLKVMVFLPIMVCVLYKREHSAFRKRWEKEHLT
jgi:hypothetical protein